MKILLSAVLLVAACLVPSNTLGQSSTGAAQTQKPCTDARVAELIDKLKEKNPRAAMEATEPLTACGERAVPALEQFLKTEKRPFVVVLAALVLGDIVPEDAYVVPALMRVSKGRGLFDSEETLQVRREAGMLLAHTAAGTRELPALLKDGDVFVRRSAAFALDDPTEVIDTLSPARLEAINEVLPALVAALDDKDEVVRDMCCEVLGQIVRSKTEPLSSKAEWLLKERGKSRGECLCGCD